MFDRRRRVEVTTERNLCHTPRIRTNHCYCSLFVFRHASVSIQHGVCLCHASASISARRLPFATQPVAARHKIFFAAQVRCELPTNFQLHHELSDFVRRARTACRTRVSIHSTALVLRHASALISARRLPSPQNLLRSKSPFILPSASF